MPQESISRPAVASLITALAESTRQNPAQFYTVEINVGYVENKIGGAAPVNISATSVGGTGSTTGAVFHATVSTGDIEVLVQPTLAKFHERFLIAADLLQDIAEDLKTSREPSRGVRAKLAKLSELAIPVALIEFVKQLVRAAGIVIE